MRGSAPVLRSPDWPPLLALLDDVCRDKGLLTRSGRPDYQQLSMACGLNHNSLYTWRRRSARPSRASLETLAQYAGQEVGPWLRAGGFAETEQVG